MKARTQFKLENDVYSVSIFTEDWSQLDLNLMVKYGEPTIDLGGTFTYGEITFTLPTSLVKINTESPFTAAFDYRDSTEAEQRATIWQLEIITRLTEAITTLRENTDSFTSETITNI